MKQLRYKNGQYKSKRVAQLERNVRLFIGFVPISFALLVGFCIQPYKITIERPVVQAQEIQQEEIISEPEEDDISNDAISALSSGLGREVTEETKNRVKFLFEKAEEYGIDPLPVMHTIWCESMFYNIQSGVVKNGIQEPSYGLLQIHLPSHKSVTKEQALDPYFSIEWAMQNWEGTAWYGYNRDTDSCTNGFVKYLK